MHLEPPIKSKMELPYVTENSILNVARVLDTPAQHGIIEKIYSGKQIDLQNFLIRFWLNLLFLVSAFLPHRCCSKMYLE